MKEWNTTFFPQGELKESQSSSTSLQRALQMREAAMQDANAPAQSPTRGESEVSADGPDHPRREPSRGRSEAPDPLPGNHDQHREAPEDTREDSPPQGRDAVRAPTRGASTRKRGRPRKARRVGANAAPAASEEERPARRRSHRT
jgi:hypothetical protein